MDESDLKDWHRIAKQLPGRSNKDCRKRWCNNVTEGLKKGQWEEDEDGRLESGIQKHGHQFVSLQILQGVSHNDDFPAGPALLK